METYIANIELINAYLENKLSINERAVFEKRLTIEPEFAELLEEQQTILSGMQRSQIKGLIGTAEKAFLKRQLLKKGLLITAGVILTGLTIWFVTTRQKETIETPQTEQIVITTTDTQEKAGSSAARATSIQTDSVKTKSSTTGEIVSEVVLLPKSEIHEPEKQSVLVDTTTSINGYAPLVKKAAMTITIDAQKEHYIFGDQGTKLVFKANTFVDQQGKPVQGEVAISLKEFYTMDDIILANLSTSASGKLLETGGMIHVEAKQSGQQLSLSKPMDVTFGRATKMENMQLFTGQELGSEINWTVAPEETEGTAIIFKKQGKDEEIAAVPFAVIEEAPVFPGCEGTEEEKRICFQASINKIVQRKFDAEACITNLGSGRNNIFTSFSISTEGKVTKMRVRAASNCLQDAAIKALESLPVFEPGRQRGHAVEVLYSLPMNFNVEGNDDSTPRQQSLNDILTNGSSNTFETGTDQVFDTIVSYARTPIERLKEILHDNEIEVTDAMLQEYERLKKAKLIRNTSINGKSGVILRKQLFEIPETYFKRLDSDSVSRGGHAYRIPWGKDQIPDRAITRIVPITRNSNVNEYAFTTMAMGWLNLDRFVNNRTPLKKFKVKIKDAQGASVKLIFKNNQRSLLNSREVEKSVFSFGDIPTDSDVKIIAIQQSQDGYYMGSTHVKVEDLDTLDLSFKKYTLKDLKRALRKTANRFSD